MRILNAIWLWCVLAFATCWCGDATAFEYRGFRTGMSLEDAMANATSIGLPLHPITNVEGAYSVGPYATAAGMANFCGGRLQSISSNIEGGVDAFASRVRQSLETWGQPVSDAASGFTEDGLSSRVSLTFTMPNNEELTVFLTSWQGRVFTSLLYSAYKAICR